MELAVQLQVVPSLKSSEKSDPSWCCAIASQSAPASERLLSYYFLITNNQFMANNYIKKNSLYLQLIEVNLFVRLKIECPR